MCWKLVGGLLEFLGYFRKWTLFLRELPIGSINGDPLKVFLDPAGVILSEFSVSQTFLWVLRFPHSSS